jgi:hypothetical protein
METRRYGSFLERQVKNSVETSSAGCPFERALDPELAEVLFAVLTGPDATSLGCREPRLRSIYDTDNLKDENHRWVAINLDNIEDAWVRRIEFRHFAVSAVYLTENTRRITVEDCNLCNRFPKSRPASTNFFYC